MKLIIDDRVEKFILGLEVSDQNKVVRYFEHFKEYSFNLPPKYLKKIGDGVWELRPGRIRIFLYIEGDKAIAVHGIVKQRQRISKRDLDLINARIREWKQR